MKKAFMFICLIAGVACSAACGKPQDIENVFEMPESESRTLEDAEVEGSLEEDAEAYPYQYGNMQKNVPSGEFMDLGGEIYFTELIDGKVGLYTYNKQTGEISLFCKDATCTHDLTKSEDCVMGDIVGNLELYNGTLYALNKKDQIMELKNGKFEVIEEGAVYRFWHANDTLYAVSKDSSLLVFPEEGKNPEILIEEYIDYWNVVFDNYLYANSSKGCSRVDLSAEKAEREILLPTGSSLVDGTHIYFMDDKNCYLYAYDMDGSNEVRLTEESILPASLNFDDEYLYFRLYTDRKLDGKDGKTIYRLKKDGTGEMEKVAELPVYVMTIYTVPGYEKLFVSGQTGFGEESSERSIYTVDKESGEVTLLEVPEF